MERKVEAAVLDFWLLPARLFAEGVKAAWRTERAKQRKAIGLEDLD